MLDHLKKLFKPVHVAQPALADNNEEVTQMTTQEDQANLATDKTAVAELTANLASVTEAMTTMQVSFTELSTKYAEAQAALAAIEADKASLVVDAKAKVVATRLTKLSAVMGDTDAPKVAAALENLDDATFETVLGTYALSFDKEAKSAMFVETGVSAEADIPAVEEESREMKIIKAKQLAARAAVN